MTDKKLKSLSKMDLLKLLRDQELEIEKLSHTIANLEDKIKDKNLSIDSAGSIAEAALQLSDIFASAQESADVYLHNIHQMQERCKAEAEEAEKLARIKADEIIKEAEQKSAEREALEKQYVDELWENLQEKLTRFCKSYTELGELVQKINIHQPSDHIDAVAKLYYE